MCPFYPLHTIIMYAILLYPVWLLTTSVLASQLPKINFGELNYTIHMDESQSIPFSLTSIDDNEESYLHLYSKDVDIAKVDQKYFITNENQGYFNGSFTIHGNWLGMFLKFFHQRFQIFELAKSLMELL